MKRSLIIFTLLCYLFSFTSCFNNRKQKSEDILSLSIDNTTEPADCTCCEQDSVSEMVLNIPEIQILAKYLYKKTNGEHGASAIIFSPDESSDLYTVNVGLNGEERFETMYLFNVDKKTCIITVEDVIEGQTLSLKDWQVKEKKNFEYLESLSENHDENN